MKKRILSMMLAGMTFLGVCAENATVVYTYADNPLKNYGTDKKNETYNVAICINDPALAGKKITAIRAYISTGENISGTSVWLSSELITEKNVNQPNIDIYEVSPKATTVENYNLSVLSQTLSQPYTLTGEPIYVGYTLTVNDNSSDLQKKPIVLGTGINPNGFFIQTSRTYLKWDTQSVKAQGVAFIEADIEGDFPQNSLGLVSYENIYAEAGKNYTALFNVSNIGATTINKIKYTYSYDGSSQVYQGEETLPSPIVPSLSGTIPLSLELQGLSDVGSHTLNLTLTEVNGKANEATNSSIEAVVNVISYFPVNRPLVEELTGIGCGYCPRGFLAMELLAEDFGEEIVEICYHYGYGGIPDPMQVTQNYPVAISGFPSSTINRNGTTDPYYGSTLTITNTDMGIADDLEEIMNQLVTTDIEVEAYLHDNTVVARTNVKFIGDYDNVNYQIGYVLICNGLQGEDWGQHNYYSGDSRVNGTPMEVLAKWSEIEYGLVFNFVAIDCTAFKGVENSLPTSLQIGKEYKNTYSFDIEGNDLVQNKANLKVAAFVIDKSTGRVLNANQTAVQDGSLDGVESINADSYLVSREYYDLTGRKASNPSNGIFIVKDKMSDSTVKSSKVMLK